MGKKILLAALSMLVMLTTAFAKNNDIELLRKRFQTEAMSQPVQADRVRQLMETLQADGIAFDLLWRKFYGDFEKMTSTTGKAPDWKNTSDSQSPYRSNVYTNAPSFTYSESISNCYGGKLLSIDLKYGTGNRFTRHLEVFRSEIPRTN